MSDGMNDARYASLAIDAVDDAADAIRAIRKTHAFDLIFGLDSYAVEQISAALQTLGYKLVKEK